MGITCLSPAPWWSGTWSLLREPQFPCLQRERSRWQKRRQRWYCWLLASWEGAGYGQSGGVCESSGTPSSVHLIHRALLQTWVGGGRDRDGKGAGGFPLSHWASGAGYLHSVSLRTLHICHITSPDTPGLLGPLLGTEVCLDTGGRAADGRPARGSGARRLDCACCSAYWVNRDRLKAVGVRVHSSAISELGLVLQILQINKVQDEQNTRLPQKSQEPIF